MTQRERLDRRRGEDRRKRLDAALATLASDRRQAERRNRADSAFINVWTAIFHEKAGRLQGAIASTALRI